MKKLIAIALCAVMATGSVISANAAEGGIVSNVDVLNSKITTKDSTINFYTYNIDPNSTGGSYFQNSNATETYKVKFSELTSPKTFSVTKGENYNNYKTIAYSSSHTLKKFNFDNAGDEYVKVSVSLSYLDKDYFTTRGYHWGYTHQDSKLYNFKYEQTDTGFKDSTLYFMSGNVVSAAAPDEKGRVEVYIRKKVGSETMYSTYFVEKKNNKIDKDSGVTNKVAEKLTFGNIDLSGSVDVNDVTALQQYLSEQVTFDNMQKFYADINSDSRIDVTDATDLQFEIAK